MVIIVLIVICIFVAKKQKQISEEKVEVDVDSTGESNNTLLKVLNKQGSVYSEVQNLATYVKQSQINQPLPLSPKQHWSDAYIHNERCCSSSSQLDCSNTYDVPGQRQCSSQFLSNL